MGRELQFKRGDGLEVIKENLEKKGAVFFIDPPYTAGGKKAGKRLYTYNAIDHAMKNTHHAKLTELVIGKNLNWME